MVSAKEFLYAMADQPKAPISSSLGSDRGGSGGAEENEWGRGGGEPLRNVPFRPHGYRIPQRGESSESIGEQQTPSRHSKRAPKWLHQSQVKR